MRTGLSTFLFPKCLSHQLSSPVPFRYLPSVSPTMATAQEWTGNQSPMRPSVLPSCVSSQAHCSKFWPRGGCPFTVSFRGVPGRWRRSCLLSGGVYIPCRTICKPGLSLLFVSWLTFDNSPGSHRAGWEREDGVAEWGPWACGPLVPIGPVHIRSTSLCWWGAALCAQLHGPMGQIAPRSRWQLQSRWVAWGPMGRRLVSAEAQ